jgi:maltose O-acetyltransferase
VNGILRSGAFPESQRPRFLRALGADVHASVRMRPGAFILGPDLRVGHSVFINANAVILNLAPVTIGDRCAIGPGCSIITTGHEIGGATARAGPLTTAPITIGAGTWLGAGVIVLQGVTIGDGCVIGAGSVVTADCAPNGHYVGTPARRLRDLP